VNHEPAVSDTKEAGDVVTLRAGETLFREGDPSDALFLVIDGEVDICHLAPGNEPVPMATLRAGAVIGECGVLAGQPRSATVIVRTDATLWTVGRQSFLTAAELGHPWAVRLLLSAARELAERLRAAASDLSVVEATPEPVAELQRLRDRLVEWSF
jgi:CRP-like cAMP-binding protein